MSERIFIGAEIDVQLSSVQYTRVRWKIAALNQTTSLLRIHYLTDSEAGVQQRENYRGRISVGQTIK